jgi:phosphoserine phosphatase RsbU/P
MTDISSSFNNIPVDSRILGFLTQINSDLNLKEAINNVLSELISLFSCEISNVVLLDFRDYTLISYSRENGATGEVKTASMNCSEELIGWRLSNRAPVIVNNLEDDHEFNSVIGSCLGVKPKNLIGIPLFTKGEFFGMAQAVNSKRESGFTQDDLDTLTILGEHIALALRNAWILDEAIRGSREAKSLYDVGIALSSSLDIDDLLDKILVNLGRVIRFDTAVIYLIDPKDGSIKQVVGCGIPDLPKDGLHLKTGQGITGRVAQTGEGIIVSDVTQNLDYIPFRPETKSEMAVPLKVGDSVIGAFNLESDKPGAYRQHDLDLLTAFASLAAITIERAKLYSEQMAARKISDELAIARRIQMTFLPSHDPEIPGFDISGINIPSADVGGDYYDFIKIVDNQLGVAIGDVSGKGIPASLIMAAFRASLKAEIRNNFAIRAILFKVNNLLFESIERDNYVTAIYSVLDLKNRVLTFSNAGHNPPILRRANGQIEYLKEGGLALGMFSDSLYEERPISLNTGDLLLFYTDGVTEAKNEADKEFGIDRLIQALEKSRTLSAKMIIEFIIQETKIFASAKSETDDLTMVVIKAL